MKVRFLKMHGAGNDFVMIDDRGESFPADAAHIASIANRPNGIGCEGVILVRTSRRADFAMKFFNPDGSEAELCGNGARCVAAFALAIGAVTLPRMRFETPAGLIEAEVVSESLVRIVMPPPRDLSRDFVNSGVPHKIVAVNDLADVDIIGEGRRIRYSSDFAPAGTNVDFVRFRPPHALDIRTYERGVEAETGACGTGAVAAAVIGVAQYGLAFPVEVRTSHGFVLSIAGTCGKDGFSAITLVGPVKAAFSGEIEV